MGGRRGRDQNTFDGIIGKDVIKRGRGFHLWKFPFYQQGFPIRLDADVFQRYAKVVEHGIKIGERVLAHADEGIRVLVRLGKETLCAEAFVAVYQLLYHRFLKYW